MCVAGIDVSYKTFVLAIRRGESRGQPRTFDNTPSGHLQVIKVLRKARVKRVCLESTGLYHLDLAIALANEAFEVMVLNPKVAKRFAEAMSVRTKTDAVDAILLAEFAERMPYEPWQRPSDQALGLRACARRLLAANKARTELKNQRHAARLTQTTPVFVLDELEQSITHFDAQIDRLRRHAMALIAEDPMMQRDFDLLISVKGIAHASAIQLLAELAALPDDMKAKQWVAMAGLDPRHHESGTSVQKAPRLSKAGNRHLRMALFMPALSAVRHDPHIRGYYQHLVEHRGLKKIQAICAVMRKLLHALHGMLQTQKPFDGSRFYVLPVSEV